MNLRKKFRRMRNECTIVLVIRISSSRGYRAESLGIGVVTRLLQGELGNHHTHILIFIVRPYWIFHRTLLLFCSSYFNKKCRVYEEIESSTTRHPSFFYAPPPSHTFSFCLPFCVISLPFYAHESRCKRYFIISHASRSI